MILDKFTQLHYFEIWAPLWHKKRVLLDAKKVGTHNKIVFTKAPTLGTEPYYLSGKTIKKYPKRYVTANHLWCYEVPLEELQPLELSENSELQFK